MYSNWCIGIIVGILDTCCNHMFLCANDVPFSSWLHSGHFHCSFYHWICCAMVDHFPLSFHQIGNFFHLDISWSGKLSFQNVDFNVKFLLRYWLFYGAYHSFCHGCNGFVNCVIRSGNLDSLSLLMFFIRYCSMALSIPHVMVLDHNDPSCKTFYISRL